MDLYTAERLVLDRNRRMHEAAERRARLHPEPAGGVSVRLWTAARLRALADRLDGRAQLQRV